MDRESNYFRITRKSEADAITRNVAFRVFSNRIGGPRCRRHDVDTCSSSMSGRARLRSRALYCWKISAGETKSVCARLRSFFSPPVRNWKMGFSPRPTSCHATRRQDFSATRFIRFLRSNARIARTPPHRENLENSPQRRTKRRLRGAGLKLRR